jgi:hypothetical protein
MLLDLATYQTLAGVVQTSFGKTSQIGLDRVFLTVKILGFVSDKPDMPHGSTKEPHYQQKNVLKLIVNTTITDKYPESKKNGTRMEAMDIVKAAIVRIVKDYKEAAKKEIEVKKKIGSKHPLPKKAISFKIDAIPCRSESSLMSKNNFI